MPRVLAGCHGHMALLPLAVQPGAGLAGSMSSTDRGTEVITWARQAARAVADLVKDMNYAQRRLTELRIFGRDHDRAPATYREFVSRTPVAVWRAPTARGRQFGA